MREALVQSARMGFIDESSSGSSLVSNDEDAELSAAAGDVHRSPASPLSDVSSPSDVEDDPVESPGHGRVMPLAPDSLIRRAVVGRGRARPFSALGRGDPRSR